MEYRVIPSEKQWNPIILQLKKNKTKNFLSASKQTSFLLKKFQEINFFHFLN